MTPTVNLGRAWTLGELEKAIFLRRNNHEIAYIAALLDRCVAEIKTVMQ